MDVVSGLNPKNGCRFRSNPKIWPYPEMDVAVSRNGYGRIQKWIRPYPEMDMDIFLGYNRETTSIFGF